MLCVVSFLGVPPKESSFLINALLLHHYKRGAYYPRGGASEFAFHIVPVIQQSGGAVLVRAPVQRILLNQQGEARGEKEGGVIYKDGHNEFMNASPSTLSNTQGLRFKVQVKYRFPKHCFCYFRYSISYYPDGCWSVYFSDLFICLVP